MPSRSSWLKALTRQKKSKVTQNTSQAAYLPGTETPADPSGTDSGSHLHPSAQSSPSGQAIISQSNIPKPSQPAQQPLATSSRSNLRNELFPHGLTYGLHVLYDPPNPLVDIIFIHGLRGDAYETWLEEKSGTYWPKALLCQDVPDARVMSYGYDASVTKLVGPVSQNRLADHAENLLGDLANVRDKDESVCGAGVQQ
jgi:hypothetical protein